MSGPRPNPPPTYAAPAQQPSEQPSREDLQSFRKMCQTDENSQYMVGHPEAGERSAVIYTLLGSCRRHGINPFDYLKDLFTRLPVAKISQIKEFTPAAWAKFKTQRQVVGQSA
jgi:hypothetical protein